MCLGIPGQLVEWVEVENYLAKVDVSGVQRTISVRLLADTGIDEGDWVLVHVGFAMAKINEAEAAITLEQLRKLGTEYDDELEQFRSSGV